VRLLSGKTILVTGVANKWSIASGIARQLHAHGATLILTYQGERVMESVQKAAAELGGGAVLACDVSNDDSLRKLAATVGKIDGLVHSIAFVKKEDLSGKVYDTSRDGFAMAMDISAYSLIALVGHLKDNLNDNASDRAELQRRRHRESRARIDRALSRLRSRRAWDSRQCDLGRTDLHCIIAASRRLLGDAE
jgi:enoyl-[acyl-carrier-protein] reductase (NADH)